MTDRGIQSAREPAEMIRRKQISSREMLDFCLAALTERDEENATRATEEADEAVARADALGRLDGLAQLAFRAVTLISARVPGITNSVTPIQVEAG